MVTRQVHAFQADSAATITMTGEALAYLQAAVANTHPEGHIVRLAVDTDQDHREGCSRAKPNPLTWACGCPLRQRGRISLDGGTWSPPFYLTTTTAPLYDEEHPDA